MKTFANALIRTTWLSSLMMAATFAPANAQTIIEMSTLKCGDFEIASSEARAVCRVDERVFQCRAEYADGRSEKVCHQQKEGREILQGSQER